MLLSDVRVRLRLIPISVILLDLHVSRLAVPSMILDGFCGPRDGGVDLSGRRFTIALILFQISEHF